MVQHEQKRDITDLRLLQHLRETTIRRNTSSKYSMFLNCALRNRFPTSHTAHTPHDA